MKRIKILWSLIYVCRTIYRTVKLIKPSCIYSIHLLKNAKLIRYIIPWVISNLKPDGSPLKDGEPWIAFESKEWLGDYLTRNMIVFEYSSGGSTIFFSKWVKKLISVEHDPMWYQHISDTLNRKNISNVEYLLLEPHFTPDGKSDFTDPHSFASREYPNMSFEAYVKSIDAFPDKSFDLVFIDGRARPSCIYHALDKVRPGGVLMLDNSERDYYLAGKELLVDWKRIDFFGPGPYGRYFWQTSVWKKPFDK